MTTLNTIENDLTNVLARMEELGKDVHMIQIELHSLQKEKIPEFKVGQWVIGVNAFPETPSRITAIRDIHFDWDNGLTHHLDVLMRGQDRWYIRLATPKEIEEHLIKVAKEKGLTGYGLYLKDANDGQIGISKDCCYEYRPINEFGGYDSLVVNSKGRYAVTNLYYQGKWATIITEKKKLPKTKEELAKFLTDYSYSNQRIDKFINEYED